MWDESTWDEWVPRERIRWPPKQESHFEVGSRGILQPIYFEDSYLLNDTRFAAIGSWGWCGIEMHVVIWTKPVARNRSCPLSLWSQLHSTCYPTNCQQCPLHTVNDSLTVCFPLQVGKEMLTDAAVPREKLRLVRRARELPKGRRLKKFVSRRFRRIDWPQESIHASANRYHQNGQIERCSIL